MVLWELIGWLPASDERVRRLARDLSGLRWNGYVLFVRLEAERTFKRELSALSKRYLAQAARQGHPLGTKATMSTRAAYDELIGQHWLEAKRAGELARMAGAPAGGSAWSLRLFPVSILSVSHTLTEQRHVGPTAVTEQATPGLFIGAIHLVTGAVRATILRTKADDEGGVYSVEAEMQRFLARIVPDGGPRPQLHLPIDYERHVHYGMAAGCAEHLKLQVVSDMLPVYFVAGAQAAVDVLQLALHGSVKRKTRATVPSVRRRSWDEAAVPDEPEQPSGPIPGAVESNIASANRKPRRAEGKKDKA
jgi:hypothetical protein